jgi:hypothetical protein
LGDFNADFEKLESNHKNFKKDKYRILTTIERLGLYDSQKITNTELEPTWIKNENTERRIDYIWINEYLVNSLVKIRVITDDTLYSDHRLLNMTLECGDLMGRRATAFEKKKKYKRTVYMLDKMNNEKWKKFRERQIDLINKNESLLLAFNNDNKNQQWTNRVWDIFEKIFKLSMDETIPKKETCKSDNPRRLKLKSKTYKLMKWCLRIIRTIKRKELSNLSISKKWDFINQLKEVLAEYGWRDFDVFKISTEIFNYEIDHDLLRNELKRLSARLKIKLDIEDRQFIIEQIENNVEKRLERYETCKKLMIDSILEREHKKITIDRLVVKDPENSEEKILLLSDDQI